MRHGRLVLAMGSTLTLLVASLGLASIGHADVFGMSGTLSLLTGGTAFPVREHSATAVVNASAFKITVPANVFTSAGTRFRVIPNFPQVAQVTSSFSTTHAAQTVSDLGGPGSFVFCPAPGNPINIGSACTNPGQASTGGWNNFIQYTAGPNQFGGSFRLVRNIFSGSFSARIGTSPLQFAHNPGVPNNRAWVAGMPKSETQYVAFGSRVVTQSPVQSASGGITQQGAIVNTLPPQAGYFETGFPLTTGMIVQKDTDPVAVTYSITGTNALTPAGGGAITLVAGGMSGGGSVDTENFQRHMVLQMNLPEPGVASGVFTGVASLLGLGWARRRRNEG